MTDVLGTCESWAAGRVLIRREDGTAVEIATADIVSGKPVPPRPSVRQRVSVREAEGHAAPLWPQVVREPLGEWELRTDPQPVDRLRKRANSCLAVGDPGLPFAEALHRVREFYGSRDRTPMVQVEAGSAVEHEFLDVDWQDVPGGEADLMLASVSRARRTLRAAETGAVPRVALDGPRVEVTTTIGSEVVGRVRAAVDGDWLGVHDLVVDPEHRRRGVAALLMAAVLEHGAERGATTVWLHVETANAPARTFYERMGLVTHHTCRYLVAPP